MDQGLYTAALEPFERETDQLLPLGAAVLDAHTHLGLDEDGRSLTSADLLLQLDAAHAARACVFPLHDPERRPAYQVPNDRVLGWAASAPERLVPFCRLDPAESPIAEAQRCVKLGARGIKLHPRAQDFQFDSPVMNDIFAFAEQERIPILIHAGRGMPPIAEALSAVALRHPGAALILAHAAICDQGILTTRLADHPAVVFDTSCFFPVDLIALFTRVGAERIVFASDPPYGQPAATLYFVLRAAAYCKVPEDALRMTLAGTMEQLLSGEPAPEPSAPACGEEITIHARLARVASYISLVGPALFAGALEQALQMLELAIAACRDDDPGELAEELELLGETLGAAAKLLASGEDGVRATFDLIYRSNAFAWTVPAGV